MLCEYGCGQEALFQFKNGKWCCSKDFKSCQVIRKKNSDAQKLVQKEVHNRPEVIHKISEKTRESWDNLETRQKRIKGQINSWRDLEIKNERLKIMRESIDKLEVREKMSVSRKKYLGKPGVIQKISEVQKESMNKPETKEKTSKASKKAMNKPEEKEIRRQKMLNGGAVYVQSFIKDQSKEELELIEIVLEFYPDFISHYKPLENKNYTVDIGHPKFKIALEWDGWYHFKDQDAINYHNKRQKEIEAEGWIFIRYNIFQKFPTKEQVKNDILKARSENGINK